MWLVLNGQGLKKRRFLEEREAENLQNVGEASFDAQFLSHDRHQDVDADRNPHLSLHGVVGVAIESFDSQVLLDPFEEQFHLPTALVEMSNGQRRQREVVGQEDQPSLVFGVVECDPAERFGIQSGRLGPRQDDRLIAAQAGGLVDLPMGAAREVEVAFATRDKAGSALGEAMQALEIDIAPVHHVKRARFDRQVIENGHRTFSREKYVQSKECCLADRAACAA